MGDDSVHSRRLIHKSPSDELYRRDPSVRGVFAHFARVTMSSTLAVVNHPCLQKVFFGTQWFDAFLCLVTSHRLALILSTAGAVSCPSTSS